MLHIYIVPFCFVSLPYLDALSVQGFEDEAETPDCGPALSCSTVSHCLLPPHIVQCLTMSGSPYHRPPFPLASFLSSANHLPCVLLDCAQAFLYYLFLNCISSLRDLYMF